MPHPRLLNIVYKQDVEGGIAAMETAIAVDNSCVQAYDTLASMELHRYMYIYHLGWIQGTLFAPYSNIGDTTYSL